MVVHRQPACEIGARRDSSGQSGGRDAARHEVSRPAATADSPADRQPPTLCMSAPSPPKISTAVTQMGLQSVVQ